MDDHRLVEALREHGPDSTAALYDTYAERLYAYCWLQLRCRDAVRVALRDTFIVAEAHVGKLRDPEWFGPWLYGIARVECARRPPPKGRAPDVPIASHYQEDVDQRVMAWQTVLSLSPLSRELLELRIRHDLSVADLAVMFDVPVKNIPVALDRAHGELDEALTAEILAHQGPYGCAERALLLRERHGEISRTPNGRLLKHAEECRVCGAFRPRMVSATKVYGLLPIVGPAAELRLRVMSYFLDPELVGYRLFVATRLTDFTADGFPVQPEQPGGPLRGSVSGRFSCLHRVRRSGARSKETSSEKDALRTVGPRAHAARVGVVLTAMVALSGGGVASMYAVFGGGRSDVGAVAGPRPIVVSRQPGRLDEGRRSVDHPDAVGHIDGVPVSATFPLGSRASSAPPTALPTPSPSSGLGDGRSGSAAKGTLLVSPRFVDLAGESDGFVHLRAHGGPVAWSAKGQGALRLDQAAGRLQPGKGVTLRVHASRRPNSQGGGTITFFPGGVKVRVTWRPVDPNPDPTTSPTPTPSGPKGPSTPPDTGGSGGPSSSGPKPAPSKPTSSTAPVAPEPRPAERPPTSGGPDPSPSAGQDSSTTPSS
ncbi:hypothetical protein GCM10022254_00320 [Actinomadura meridiana]|uniref:Sigma-70 family RNA polymerase sigma factor n=1 Tax=Actinomadura meridiana TaxID=559626 RepID=A0ABP8BRB3_9ACTN